MEINDYQSLAADSMQFDLKNENSTSICLLGLAGEVGELLSEYKKKLRDGESYHVFKEKVIEEMGDIMWYLSSLATIEDIELSEILKFSEMKIKDRWDDLHDPSLLNAEEDIIDSNCIAEEQFPREFIAEINETIDDDGIAHATIFINGKQFGDNLRDNSYSEDYYRFHDIFHLSYVVVLGWSPVARKFFGCKRISDIKKDEVEDGGRAAVIDEAVSILIFEYAKSHNFLLGTGGIDFQLLRTIKLLTKHLEVNVCSTKDWEKAILLGFDLWRELKDKKNGRIVCNLHERTMVFEELS